MLGFTLIEFIAFIAMVVCVAAVAHASHDVIGGRSGWLVGGLLGLLLFILIVFAFAAVVDFGFKGVPRLPKCRNGCCRGEAYAIQEFRGGFVRVCRCGGRYKRRGKRFVVVNEDGTEAPYLVWRPFRGWYPDE